MVGWKNLVRLKGIIASMPTPFTSKDKLNEEALRVHLKFLLRNRIHAVAPATTTGEFWSLTDSEYTRLVEIVVDQVNSKVPVIAGVGSNNTAIAIQLARRAKNLGVDGIFVVPPYFNRPTQEGLYHHFRAVLDAVDIPTLIYNEPHRAAVNVSSDTINRLFKEYSNIIGLKEGDFNQVQQDIALTEGRLSVFTVDVTLLPNLALGGLAPCRLLQTLYQRNWFTCMKISSQAK
jgi:4-hydroxy-tetrahydrodipicolinate synthase